MPPRSPQRSDRLDLPYLMPAQAQKHVTHNDALHRLDLVVQLVLEELERDTPPLPIPARAKSMPTALAPTRHGPGRGAVGRLE
ncbi:DUF2793 domain-containing protein [Tritonibacter scottomollicae]|uniref:Uncharacterized protein DUF2793 n=1 Tax=Tritonibacter scottomollicae TaxID=483013 RepID=A0A2T1A7Y0_TRISK|nr:DUF2793 domain-containing protein [Tritonibacter scottomollicae]PRZ44691.1 uncharacterized protein DUF2793 [Tritonibacter scottomollicae]